MTPKKHTIEDVREAGFEVGLASGSVEVEQAALEEARGSATPESVAQDAEQVANEIARMAVAQGAVGGELSEMVSRATKKALEEIQGARDERVDFHERALEIAKETPDVFVVSGKGVENLYVACKANGRGWDEDAQAILDSLADPK